MGALDQSAVSADVAGPIAPAERAPRWELAIVMLIGIVGAAAVWWSTALRGVGVTADSITYVSTARNIVDGVWFVSAYEDPMVTWPIGYPSVLAGVAWVTGTDPLDAGRLLGAATSLASALLAWGLIRRLCSSAVVRVSAVAAIALSNSLLAVNNKLLTDSFYATGVMALALIVMYMIRSPHSWPWRWMAVAAVTIWALFLVRYVGVTLAGCVGIAVVVAPAERPLRTRVPVAAAVVAIAAALPAIYLVARDEQAGAPASPGATTSDGFGTTAEFFLSWAIGKPPTIIPSAFGWLVAFGVLFLAGWVVVASLREQLAVRAVPSEDPPHRAILMSADLVVVATLLLTSLAALVSIRLVRDFDFGGRTALFVYPLAVLLIAGVIDQLPTGSTRRPIPIPMTRVVTIGFAAWALVVAVVGVTSVTSTRTAGSGLLAEGNDPLFAELEMVSALLPTGCNVTTNDARLVYLAGLDDNPVQADVNTPAASAGCIVIVRDDTQPVDATLHLDPPVFVGEFVIAYLPGQS